MQFRWRLDSDLTEEQRREAEAPWSRRTTLWKRDLEALGLTWESSPYVIRRMNEAILALRDYRTFGEALPRVGGTRDQSAQWLRAMRAILFAEAEADREQRAAEANQASNS